MNLVKCEHCGKETTVKINDWYKSVLDEACREIAIREARLAELDRSKAETAKERDRSDSLLQSIIDIAEELKGKSNQLAEAKALLARVFGEKAHECYMRDGDYTYCNLLSDVCDEHTRRPDCPNLPWEGK